MFHIVNIGCEKRLSPAGKCEIGTEKIALFPSASNGHMINTPFKHSFHYGKKVVFAAPQARGNDFYTLLNLQCHNVIKQLLDSSSMSAANHTNVEQTPPSPGVPVQTQNASRHLTHTSRVLISLERQLKTEEVSATIQRLKNGNRVKVRSISDSSLPTFLRSSPGRSHK